MTRSKSIIIVACLFLVQTQVARAQDLGTSSLNLVEKVSPTSLHVKEIFASEFNILTFALGMYQMDTEDYLSKEDIKEKLIKNQSFCERQFNVVFDLDNIDFNKKGLTRYYPFTLNDKSLVIRIFNINEKYYLPDLKVFYEGTFEDSEVGFQIIPGVKEILASQRTKRFKIANPFLYTTHP